MTPTWPHACPLALPPWALLCCALGLASLLCGCISSAPSAAEVRREANRATDSIAAITEEIAAHAPEVERLCGGAMFSAEHKRACDAVKGLWQAARVAIRAANDATAAYDDTRQGLALVLAAIDRAREVADKLLRELAVLRRSIDG